MAVVTLDEMKNYLRVDFDEDDVLLNNLISAAESICMNVARLEDSDKFSEDQNARIAVMYAVAYLYEHRENADHNELALSLRALLFGIRQEGF
ncbi:MAG: head-tail connector protein [Suipraeoptans sp.]